MQILDELYNEMSRLFIAGSRFAKDDPRVVKHISVLERMGEKAPVLKKLAEKVTLLVETGEPDALADAGRFLHAVMATQGANEVSGEAIEQEPMIGLLPETNTPYLRLRPVLDALTNAKQGRFEIVKNAFEEGLLNDFRLHAALVAGLDDKYAELVEYLYKIVLPGIGAPMMPYLLRQYNPGGKKSDAYRLSLLGSLGYEGAEKLALDAIIESDQSIAVEGIKILGSNPQNEDYLLKLAGDKKAAIREAALVGLVVMDSTRGKALMLETLLGAKYKSAVCAAGYCDDPEYAERILEVVKAQYQKLKTAQDAQYQDENNKLYELFPALAGKYSPDVMDFYIEVMQDTDYTKPVRQNKIQSYQFQNVRCLIRDDLIRSESEEILRVYESTMSLSLAQEVGLVAKHYFRLVCGRYAPQKVFSVFSRYYANNLIAYEDITRTKEFVLTKEWKEFFIQKKDMAAIGQLLHQDEALAPGMKAAVLLRLKECVAAKRSDPDLGHAVGRFVEITPKKSGLLFKSELGKLAEVCYSYFEKMDGYMIDDFYKDIGTDRFIKMFHPDYTEKFRMLVPLKRSKVYQTMADVLQGANTR